jgi:hypothetical protein
MMFLMHLSCLISGGSIPPKKMAEQPIPARYQEGFILAAS